MRPFRAVVLSTSRLAAELPAVEGVLRDVGVVGARCGALWGRTLRRSARLPYP